MYLLDEVFEEDGLLPQWIVNQPLREEDHAVGEVVLREPGYHTLLLHVRATRDVDDQVSQVLPVPECIYTTTRLSAACLNLHTRLRAVYTYLTTSTAPGRTLGSLPMMETLAAKEPSMLKTTHSIVRGNTVR